MEEKGEMRLDSQIAQALSDEHKLIIMNPNKMIRLRMARNDFGIFPIDASISIPVTGFKLGQAREFMEQRPNDLV